MKSSKNSTYNVVVKPFEKKDIFIPTSKSYANRLLVLAAIYEGAITIHNLPESTDVLTMIDCLKQIGLEIQGNMQSLTINNSFPACEENLQEKVHLFTGDGGTTNRFLMGILALGKKEYVFHPTERITERPVDQFVEELKSYEVKVRKVENAWLSIQGPLRVRSSSIEIDCSASTQFATSMQLVLSPQNIEVVPKNLHASAMYFDITNVLCNEFKKGINEVSVPLDFSSFGYPVALAAVIGELELTDFGGVDPLQADSQIISILQRMGASVVLSQNCLTIKKSQLKATEVNCADFPDLVPTIAYLCSYAEGTSYLKNVEVLRHKESDRIAEVLNILKSFSIDSHYDEPNDTIVIHGSAKITNAVDLETAKDHRMIMVAYLFMRTNAGGTIHHVEHINKSYPHFLEVMS